jgi:hypothetical protein
LDSANPAGVPLYDPHTGRCNDKVYLSGKVERNVGAESAIEAGFLHFVRSRLTGTRTGIELGAPSMKPDEVSNVV